MSCSPLLFCHLWGAGDFVTYILSGAADEVFTKHGLTPAPKPAEPAEKPRNPTPKKKP